MGLTQGYDNTYAAMIANTPNGMAYWAGTGPQNTHCWLCEHWGDTDAKSGPSYKRTTDGVLKPKRCRKFTRMNSGEQCLRGVPAATDSCKYFSAHPSPPDLIND